MRQMETMHNGIKISLGSVSLVTNGREGTNLLVNYAGGRLSVVQVLRFFMRGSAVKHCFYPFFIVLFVFVTRATLTAPSLSQTCIPSAGECFSALLSTPVQFFLPNLFHRELYSLCVAKRLIR